MLRSRTTSLPSKDLLRPSTSMAMSSLPLSLLRMTDACRRLQSNRHRLPDAQVFRLLGARFDAEYEAGALLPAVDHGRRKLGLRRDEADARDLAGHTAVAADVDAVVNLEGWQGRLRHEEAHLGVVRRQQGNDRSARLHHFAGAEVDFLHAADHRACHLAPLQAGAGRIQSSLGRTQGGLGVVEALLRTDGAFEQRLRPLVGLPGIDDGGLVLRHGGALQIGIEGKQRRADVDPVALAHGQGFQPTRFLGADEDELGLDPALKFQLRPLAAPVLKGGEGEADHGEARHGKQALVLHGHGTLFPVPAVSRSQCAASSPVTSSGSILENRPSQMTAKSKGATISWGKRAAASLENSPRATASLATARINAMPRATTSR